MRADHSIYLYMRTRPLLHAWLLCCFPLAIVTSCGGGGGGGSAAANAPGDAALSVERGTVDSGDLFRVNVEMFDPNPTGVILKLRFDKAIRYSPNSALLAPGKREQARLDPAFEVTVGDYRYLVFFISPQAINFRDYLSFGLTLKAISTNAAAPIGVDLDSNDPNVPDSREFDEKRPRFTPLDESWVRIRGDETVDGTPTPKPTPTP